MALIDDIKQILRITSSAYNTEITDLIATTKADLDLVGLLKIVETDSLIKRAITLYCKANFGYNKDSEKYQISYESLRNHLSLSVDYAFYTITFEVVDESDTAIDEAQVTFNDVVKYTNTEGKAIFYVHPGNNYEYIIYHEDYQEYVDSDDGYYNVDVTADATIDIILEA